jgi:hypothetical protein
MTKLDRLNKEIKFVDFYRFYITGVVVRSYDEKISFKIISNEHLLQNNS